MGEEKPKRGRPPSDRGPLAIVLTVKGRKEWRDWLDARADEADVSPTDLIDQGLMALAKAKKWGDVPSRT